MDLKRQIQPDVIYFTACILYNKQSINQWTITPSTSLILLERGGRSTNERAEHKRTDGQTDRIWTETFKRTTCWGFVHEQCALKGGQTYSMIDIILESRGKALSPSELGYSVITHAILLERGVEHKQTNLSLHLAVLISRHTVHEQILNNLSW